MNKKRSTLIAYLITLPAIVMLYIFKVRPFFNAFILSFKNLQLAKGIKNSPWVGFSNYIKVIENHGFFRVLGNTLAMNSQYIIISSLMALLLALSISSIKNLKVRYTLCLIILIPLFIPSSVYGIAFIDFVWSGYKANPSAMPIRFIYALFESIKTVGIPVIIAVAVSSSFVNEFGSRKNYNILMTIIAYALTQITLILSSDFDMLNLMYNPLLYEKADTVLMSTYRNGMNNGNFGWACSLWVLKYIIELILLLIIFSVIRKIFKNYLLTESELNWEECDNSCYNSFVAYIIPGIYSALIIAFIVYIAVKAFSQQFIGFKIAGASIVTYIIIDIIAALFCSLISLLLAYPLTIHGKAKKVYSILLLIIVAAGSGGIHEYLYFRQLRMVNTYFPIIITGAFSLISVFAIAGIFNSRYNKFTSEDSIYTMSEGSIFSIYLKHMLKPAIGVAALQFAYLWGSYYNSLIYINKPNMMSPTFLLRNMINGPTSPSYMLALILIIVPVTVLIALGKIIISDILVSKIR